MTASASAASTGISLANTTKDPKGPRPRATGQREESVGKSMTTAFNETDMAELSGDMLKLGK